MSTKDEAKKDPDPQDTALATFAGGCFWCMESPFLKLDGVVEVVSGYTGGEIENPTYEQVTSGKTGHYEAVQVTYQPEKISYQELLDVFWRQIDPTDPGGSFVDRGPQYRSAIFYHNPEQKDLAFQSRQGLNQSGRFSKPVVTEILPAGPFYKAEDYHQKFFLKSPQHYQRYRSGSGRDQALERIWGDQT
jgi:methionine-S-sulfoxide reductase